MLFTLPLAAGLFCLGVYLSALFSGAETAFYRLSTLRLTFDAAAGSKRARRMLKFAQNPARFVATLLVGNNVANYVTTAAVGIAVGAVAGRGGGGAAEVIATWLIAPVVFVGGELTPKRLSYLAPSHFLGRASSALRVVEIVAAPVAVPLAKLAGLLEKRGTGGRRVGGVLGRGRLTEVLNAGHRAGLLTDAQDRLVETILSGEPGRAADLGTPVERAVILPFDCDRDDVLGPARRLAAREALLLAEGVPAGTLPTDPGQFAGYVTAAEVAAADRPPRELLRPLPPIPRGAARLEAAVELRRRGESVGLLIAADGTVSGVLRERGLLRDLFGRV